ncbi:hypothetical protein N7490_006430 [Penicillium lividum]|nr:hypothetical protein N7490_006430 [Penicillium lividum]
MAVGTDQIGDLETDGLLRDPINAPTKNGAKKFLILIACAGFILSADFGVYLSVAPQTAIFEQIICRNHLELQTVGNVTQDPCKSEAVQGELALINGYKDGFDVLPGILLSLPYGVLSDHWGRKPVLLLATLGILLSELWTRVICAWSDVLPLRLVWLSSMWQVIGGGSATTTSVALNMVADVFSEEERSTALFRLMACVLVSEVLATPASAYMMTFSLWIPYILSFVIIVLGCIPFLFLPETLEDAKAKRTDQQGTVNNSIETTALLGKQTFSQNLRHKLREFNESIFFMWKDSNVAWIIVVAFVSIMSRQSTNILLQYASKKFNWSIAQASLLITIRGIFGIFSYLVLIPTLTFLAARYLNLHGKFRDYRLGQLTGVFGVIGFTVMGLAPSPVILIAGLVIFSFSTAFGVSARSLATALVPPDHVGTLYSALGVSQSIGTLIAGPLFAYLFQLGMHLGSVWMGLPFIQAAICFVFATAAMWRIQLSRSFDEEGGEQEALVS